MLDRTGQQLGNYVLKSLLGQGGFADVYLGEHIYLKRLVAVKVLQMRMTENELQEFVLEAQMIAALDHTHIVRVHDFGVDRDTSFLVMDYAPHGSLRHKHAKRIPLPLATIVSYVKQVAAALQYAHDQKLIHRDIKPENMLLGKHNDVLVSDFGLAVVARSTRSWEEQKIAGTAPYMSPEHFRAKAVPASDQYSLAVAVYEWLTGSPPFDEGNFMQLGYQHSYVPVPPLHEKNPTITVPARLEQVVMKGLAKEPGQRFERIEAFANALEQALKPQNPIIATPPTPPKPAIVSPPIGTTLVTYREHTGWVNAVAWVPNGTHIASGSNDASAQIWDARTGSQKSSNKASVLMAVAWSLDGKRLAYGGGDFKVYIWDPVQRHEILQYTGHSDWIYALSWSPDGRYIVSGGGYAAGKAHAHDFTLHIWDTITGTCLLKYKGHTKDVYAIQWSPDGRFIASGGDDNVVRVWEVTTGRLVYTYTRHTLIVKAIAWSRDSRRLVSGSADGTVQVWDALTGDKVLSYGGQADVVMTVAWSSDGRQIASGGGDTMVHIWDAMTGKTIYVYKGHSDFVNALSWSPDSTRIASGGADKTVQVWQAR
ncbi:MAG: serine/threonine-protein kinase [Ktedonobacteraceae bacterium]